MIAIAPQRRSLAALRWAAAALTVASVHGGAAWVALNWRPAEAAAGAPEVTATAAERGGCRAALGCDA